MINCPWNEGQHAEIAEKIRALELEKGWKSIYQGEDVRQALHHEQRKQKCEDLLHTFLSRDWKIQESLH